jgi:hypothetical protein
MNESPSSMAPADIYLLLLWRAVLPQRNIPFQGHIAVPAPYRTMRVMCVENTMTMSDKIVIVIVLTIG